jgi:hypothetical protein
VTYSVTYIATGSAKAAQSAGLSAALFMGIGELRGGKMGANGKMQYNSGFTTANHRDGATNDRISNSIANHLKHIL